jgi:hypothetical protein
MKKQHSDIGNKKAPQSLAANSALEMLLCVVQA